MEGLNLVYGTPVKFVSLPNPKGKPKTLREFTKTNIATKNKIIPLFTFYHPTGNQGVVILFKCLCFYIENIPIIKYIQDLYHLFINYCKILIGTGFE